MNKTLSILSIPPMILYGLSAYRFCHGDTLHAIYFWLVGMVVDRLMNAAYKAIRRCRARAKNHEAIESPRYLRCGGMVCTTIHPLFFPVRRATPNGKK